MNLLENIREGLRSIAGNRLRTVLTSLIIAIGIASLVGILTAIEGIQTSLTSSFEGLGANVFDIQIRTEVRRFGGRIRQMDEPIDYRQATTFKRRYKYNAAISTYALISGAAQAKGNNKKTNPNVQVTGVDENYVPVKNYKLRSGRNFSANDLQYNLPVALLGSEVATKLFGSADPQNKAVRVLGGQFRIIGVLDTKGGFTGGEADRVILIPLDHGRVLAGDRKLTFNMTASVNEITDQETAIGEARGLMRQIRRDVLGEPDSFEIVRADDLIKQVGETTGVLRIGGFGIGFITLLGAAIALLNIMLVSVTERTREIGIRKSLGATPQRIREQFLIEAIVVCLMGGLGGIIMGLGVGNLISLVISQGEGGFVVPWPWMALGIVVCVAVGLFAGIYPAVRASKLDPIEALRYE